MSIVFKQGTHDYLQIKDGNVDDEQILVKAKDKIKELFNLKNVYFLFGSGTSCNAIPCMKGLHQEAVNRINNAGIGDYLNQYQYDAKNGNLEELLGILYSRRFYLENARTSKQRRKILRRCETLIDMIEGTIFDKINVSKADKDFETVLNTYRDFYRKVALRNKDLARICVFTTNNDLFNERAMDSENIHYINGFSGGLNRYFNPAMFNYTYSKRMDTNIDRYEPTENMVYLYKIHGSINWKETVNENSFFQHK